MAYTELPLSFPSSSGMVAAYTAAAAAGNKVSNDGRTLLIVKNGSGVSVNVTITTPGTVDGLAVPDRVIAVAAGAEKWIGGLAPSSYNNPDGATDAGEIYVDYSAVTTVTIAALHHP